MGLAASQARLLLLTARKSDLEFRAQQITNAEMILAMQTEEIARTYSNKLSNQTLRYIDQASQTEIEVTAANLSNLSATGMKLQILDDNGEWQDWVSDGTKTVTGYQNEDGEVITIEVEEQNAGGPLVFADEHVIGVAKGCDDEMIKDLNNHFMGECTEVGMYLAMSRQADREGYPEIAEAFKRYAWEEAEHASKFAELLGDCVWDTKTNLEKRMEAECGACEDKKRIATRAKALNLDAIHDTVHEMAKDEARHGKGFEGLYNRYFKK